MNYPRLNSQLRRILRTVKDRSQFTEALMLIKRSETEAKEAEAVETEKQIDVRTREVENKVRSLRIWMSPYLSYEASGTSKQSILNSQAGEPLILQEEMVTRTLFSGEALLEMAHGANENVTLFISLGAVEVSIAVPGTAAGASGQYRLSFQMHFSHGADATRKFYFTGYFEDKDANGAIIPIPIPAGIQEIDTTTFKVFDIKYEGASPTTTCKIVYLQLHRHYAPPPSSGT